MAADRMQVSSFAAVGSIFLYADKIGVDNTGVEIFAKWSGNGSGKLYMNNFPDAAGAGQLGVNTVDYFDVTSWFVGAAQFTQAHRLIKYTPGGLYPYGLCIQVDSLQASNTVKFATHF